jgi:Raf kinase inhibitor-like YbhB/YbcL family protein
MHRCWLFALLLIACSASACTAAPSATATTPPGGAALQISSTAFQPGELIPQQYTCSGKQISPPLAWSDIPQGAKSLALIVDDPDAPGGIWVHWVVYNLPPDASGLPEGASQPNQPPAGLPSGAQQGKNSWGRSDYGGPCPPSGQHRYFFKLYALDTTFSSASLDKSGLLKAMEGHILGQGEVTGVFHQ